MKANEPVMLRSKDSNQAVPLKSTRIEGNLHDLMCEVSMEQTFENTESRTIEAVYTFPLPHRAILLELEVTIDERMLEGVVIPAPEADERYEDAISDRDGAVLLQKVSSDDNLYTMNVGNIRPGETIKIHFRYAMLNELHHKQLRISIPTTVSPRYGNPIATGIQPHQVPGHSLTVEHQYSLEFRVEGLLAMSNIECPSHNIDLNRREDFTLVTLKGDQAFLDRDFILNLTREQISSATAVSDIDLDGYMVMASFMPALPRDDSGARDIRIVIDCSGSMNGDSIMQARVALKSILGELRAEDQFNLILFGTTTNKLFPGPVLANKSNITRAQKLARGLNADMGGTEMQGAIETACEMSSDIPAPADILLITDGEVWDDGIIIDIARTSGHRVFSVGVGSGVSEGFVRGIAEATGGMAEFVAPNEDMARHIIRHFERIYSPRANVNITWPAGVTHHAPAELPVIYSSDTLHVFGHSDAPVKGDVILEMQVQDTLLTQKASIETLKPGTPAPSTLARIAAHHALKDLSENEMVELAVRYQLMTARTSYLVIDKREAGQQADGEPAIRKVANMLTAGWGGSSTVVAQHMTFSLKASSELYGSAPDDMRDFGESCLMEIEEDDFRPGPWDTFSDEVIDLLNDEMISTLEFRHLESLGINQWITRVLQSLAGPDFDEHEVVIAFLFKLVTLRFAEKVDKTIVKILQDHLSPRYPDGFMDVMTALVKATEKSIPAREVASMI